jgi:hypothetical protein
LSRFVDANTGEYLPAEYGRCDREVNCGYFVKPEKSTMAQLKQIDNYPRSPYICHPVKPTPKIAPAYIPFEVLKQSRKGYEGNKFVQYLLRLFGPDVTERLIKTYHLGSSNSRWPGACVFWFIDITGKVRAGQVKLFDNTGHTTKYTTADGDQRSCTTWLHSILKYNHEARQETLPQWLATYLEQGGNYASCLYGEHLLKQGCTRPVAIVEAPATAIVASVYLPEFIWLAAGSLSYLTEERCKALNGRQTYLFPDISKDGKAYDLWSRKAKELSQTGSFTVSDLLEKNATPMEKIKGLDLRDYLTRFDYKLFHPVKQNTFGSPEYVLTIDQQQFKINALVSISQPGNQFGNYCIVTFMLTKDHFCDVLFNAVGELIKVNDDYLGVIYARIAKDLNKTFVPGKINGVDCLVNMPVTNQCP